MKNLIEIESPTRGRVTADLDGWHTGDKDIDSQLNQLFPVTVEGLHEIAAPVARILQAATYEIRTPESKGGRVY